MKKHLYLAIAVLAFSLIVNSSQAQDNPLFRHISPEASGVYHINLPLLASKISWADLMTRIPLEKMKSKNQQWLALVMDPAQTGVDFKSDILITTSDDPMGSFTTVILHLTDTSKFRISLRKQLHGVRISRYPDKSYSAFKGTTGAAWNKDFAVLVIIKPSAPEGSGNGSKSPNYEAMTVSKSIHALKGWDSSPLTNDPAFKEAFSNDADFQMYTEKTNYYKGLDKVFPHGLMNSFHWDSLLLYKNSYCGLWFSNGKMTAHCVTVMKPDVAEELAKLPPPAVNPDLLAHVPKGNLLGLASIRFNPGLIPFLLNRIGLGHMVDSALSSENVRVEDLAAAFKGDLLMAAIEPDQTDSTQKSQGHKPAIYTAISINDPSALRKWTDMLGKKKDSLYMPSPDGSGDSVKRVTPIGKLKHQYVVKDNILLFSGNKALAEGYFANTEKRNTDAELIENMKANPVFLWINMGEIVNFLLGPVRSDDGGDSKMKMLNGLHVLDKFIITKSAIHDGKITTDVEFSVTKKDQNFLKTIFDLIPESKPKAPQH
ncbi:MAG TPA: DUF4836 family protein [Puia sp.]